MPAFPNERTRGTYFPENWEPLRRSGQLELVDGDQQLATGVRSVTVPGHTASIQAVWVEDGGESLLFLGGRLQLGRAHGPAGLGPVLRPRPDAQHRDQTQPAQGGGREGRAPRIPAMTARL